MRKARERSGTPVALMSAGVSTSMGASESAAVRSGARVPVVTMTGAKVVVVVDCTEFPWPGAACACASAQANEIAAASSVGSEIKRVFILIWSLFVAARRDGTPRWTCCRATLNDTARYADCPTCQRDAARAWGIDARLTRASKARPRGVAAAEPSALARPD